MAPNRAPWVAEAYRRYHAGQISRDELARIVAEHRGDPPPEPITDRDA